MRFSLVYFAFSLLPLTLFAAAERIERIDVENNERSRTATIIASSDLKIGQEVTQQLIADTEAHIGSNPLFEKVTVKQVPGSDKNHVVIKIWVKEKMSWFIVPGLSFSDGKVSGGITGVETNLFGRFKKIALFAD